MSGLGKLDVAFELLLSSGMAFRTSFEFEPHLSPIKCTFQFHKALLELLIESNCAFLRFNGRKSFTAFVAGGSEALFSSASCEIEFVARNGVLATPELVCWLVV